jgi:hypothetical protein
MSSIQRVEVDEGTSLFCPFCGQKVLDMEAANAGETYANPCSHTLFISHDEGFDYRSTVFDEAKEIRGVDDFDLMGSDAFRGMDGFTDDVKIGGAIKFAAYVGPPSGFGTYVGFAPGDT